MQKLNRNETELGILSYSVVKVVRLKGVPASGKANPGERFMAYQVSFTSDI